MADTTTLKATCLCGAAAHTITIPSTFLPLKSYFCNCTSCRRITGTMYLSVALLPGSYSPSQDLLNNLVAYDFSPRFTYFHCKTCGCLMLSRSTGQAEHRTPEVTWDAVTGTFEKFDGVIDLYGHWHVDDTVDGGFTDFLTKYNKKPLGRWPLHDEKAEQLSLGWRAPEHNDVKPSMSDKLHAHCKCKGVEMWISRPSHQSTQARRAWPDLIIPFHSREGQERSESDPWWLCANGTKFLAGVCACDSCRLVSGMDVVEWAFVPKVDISTDAGGEKPLGSKDGKLVVGSLQCYNSSDGVNRYFCGTCGAMVFFEWQDRPELVDLAVGLLDAPEGARAETWLEWRTSRVSYREDGVKRAESLVVALEEGLKEYERQGSNERRGSIETLKR